MPDIVARCSNVLRSSDMFKAGEINHEGHEGHEEFAEANFRGPTRDRWRQRCHLIVTCQRLHAPSSLIAYIQFYIHESRGTFSS